MFDFLFSFFFFRKLGLGTSISPINLLVCYSCYLLFIKISKGRAKFSKLRKKIKILNLVWYLKFGLEFDCLIK